MTARSILRWLGVGVLTTFAVALGVLFEAHWEMRRIRPLPPDPAFLEALAEVPDAPVRVRSVVTATQRSELGVIGHPSFVLEWADGRSFLIDAGMDRHQAQAFGALMELGLGSDAIQPLGSIVEQMGEAAQGVDGIAFTHLHQDHTGGIRALCAVHPELLAVFQTPDQAARANFVTWAGQDDIAQAGCTRVEPLAGGPVYEIPGFPGLVALPAAGHTPGSTVFAARVRGAEEARTWIFSGDMTNSLIDLLENRPKPWLYSVLIVPEAPEHLELWRRWLAALDRRPGIMLAVSHDTLATAERGLPVWGVSPLSGPPASIE
ncbi:MBL fold metallo-hydrolase [Myxococcota bacterium]|nr:MBL fold metallo-hydrolase [Myxococcota bacterium]